MSRWLLGLDLGGGSVRCLAAREDGGARAVASRPWSFEPVPETSGLGWDLDLEKVWAALAGVAREARERAGASPEEVAGVAVSSHRFSTVVLDRDGEALLAVPNRDARGSAQWLGLGSERSEALARISGLWPMAIHASARLLWMREHRPEALDRAAVVFSLSDWVSWRLCGAQGTDPSQAGCTGFYGLAERAWSHEALGLLGLPSELLPEVREAGSSLGGLSSAAAEALGLPAGVPVGLGGGDTQCGLLGVGALEPGQAAWVAGTTAPLQLVTEAPVLDPEGVLWSGHHVVPGRSVVESNGGPVGDALAWMGRLLFPEAPQPEARLFAEAGTRELGASGLLSTLGADRLDPRRPGLPIGQITLSHLASPSGHARSDLARAVVEGMCCGVRAHLEELEALASLRSDALRLAGGLARSEVLGRVLAGVMGREVSLPGEPEATALGAALCAGVASGCFGDLHEAAGQLVPQGRALAPSSEEREAGERLYAAWCGVRQASGDAEASARAWVTPFAFQAAAQGSAAATPARRPEALVSATFDAPALDQLREGMQVEYAPFREAKRLLKGDGLVEALEGKQVFVTEIDLVDADALARLPELRVIASCRGDAVNVDVEACTAFGIPLLNAPGRNADAVADLTVAFALALSRKLVPAAAFLKDPEVTAGNMGKMGQAFVQLQGGELWGKTVGLVGLGAVGRAVARRLQGFGLARLLVADPFVSDEQATLVGAEKVELAELLAESDVVSLHAAVTEETRGLLGAAELAGMKPGAFLVNTARAALVDEEALHAALEGSLGGAALDTFSVEPPGADHPLVQHPRVVCTPHVGGNTLEVASHQGAIISRALGELLRGGRPGCVRNPEVLDAFSWDGPRPAPSEEELARLRDKAGPAVTDLQRDEQKKKESGAS